MSSASSPPVSRAGTRIEWGKGAEGHAGALYDHSGGRFDGMPHITGVALYRSLKPRCGIHNLAAAFDSTPGPLEARRLARPNEAVIEFALNSVQNFSVLCKGQLERNLWPSDRRCSMKQDLLSALCLTSFVCRICAPSSAWSHEL